MQCYRRLCFLIPISIKTSTYVSPPNIPSLCLLLYAFLIHLHNTSFQILRNKAVTHANRGYRVALASSSPSFMLAILEDFDGSHQENLFPSPPPSSHSPETSPQHSRGITSEMRCPSSRSIGKSSPAISKGKRIEGGHCSVPNSITGELSQGKKPEFIPSVFP